MSDVMPEMPLDFVAAVPAAPSRTAAGSDSRSENALPVAPV